MCCYDITGKKSWDAKCCRALGIRGCYQGLIRQQQGEEVGVFRAASAPPSPRHPPLPSRLSLGCLHYAPQHQP